ncbi:hypothetical protein R1sor_004947 [Riccia sorocarpa]|uniref:Uncharacterized protein n=1 Tax=Riccia sorocarpa TaxID=122646 RepID=A0ABD3HKB9_9MARC
MLSACVLVQHGVVTEEIAAEEEEKFIKHFDQYRQKFWKTVWYSGKNDRHLIIDGRRAKRIIFRYAVWVIVITGSKKPKKQRARLRMHRDSPETILTLKEELKVAVEKLPQVYDPRKLQTLQSEDTLQQAKALEPRADQVITTFTKLKRKKEELTPKTLSPEIAVDPIEDVGTEGLADSTPVARRSIRKPRRKKDAEEALETEATTATTGAVDVEVIGPTEAPVEPTQETRNAKRLKKKPAEAKDFSNGEFRVDLQFEMEDKWVAVKSNLIDIIHALKSKKQGSRSKVHVPALEAITGMCKRLKLAGRKPRQFIVNGKKCEQGVDLILFDIPTGRAVVAGADAPRWNWFPAAENYPRHLFNFSSKILDDSGYVVIFHAGSLESSQQIADALDAMNGVWKHFLSYDVCNDAPTYAPNLQLSVCHRTHIPLSLFWVRFMFNIKFSYLCFVFYDLALLLQG